MLSGCEWKRQRGEGWREKAETLVVRVRLLPGSGGGKEKNKGA